MAQLKEVEQVMREVKERHPGQLEFHQAVEEVLESVMPIVLDDKKLQEAEIISRIVEPERVVSFRVVWEDDQGKVQVNRGFRVQFSSAIGPYKGGLRFRSGLGVGTLKFLGFEQIFKNSLTSLPLGGGKGGADFDPKGKSDREVMRFCQAFMTELYRHIGPDMDVPAGDIGVGGREIGYLYGQYKKIRQQFHGVITGKGLSYGGSLIRPEATGYGCVYFLKNMMHHHEMDIEGKICAISGSGNVAQYTAEKAIDIGLKVVSFSDSSGYVYDKDGFDLEKLEYIKEIKNVRRQRISALVEKFPSVQYVDGARPWELPIDIALPCATQNEIELEDAKTLKANGCIAVCEGANMPVTNDALEYFRMNGVMHAPGKAANAGGVAVSGLEQTQNALRLSWTKEEVDQKLQEIMGRIHLQCLNYGSLESVKDRVKVDYIKGANIGGFMKVADAMLAQGI